MDILSVLPNVAASVADHPSTILPDAAPNVIVTDLFGSAWYDRASAAHQLEQLRQRFPAVPIVLVTAHWQAERDRAVLPVDAVMTKPFDVDALAQLVLSFDTARPAPQSQGATAA